MAHSTPYKVTEVKIADIIAQPTPLSQYKKVDDNIITSLLKKPFKERSREEQYKIVLDGRPGPFIDIFLKPGKKGKNDPTNMVYHEDYSLNLYDKYVWLAASMDTDKLHCWSCVLMYKGGEKAKWVEGISVGPNSSSLLEVAEAHCHDNDHCDNLSTHTKLIDKAADIMFANLKMSLPQFGQKGIMNRTLLRKLTEVAISVYALGLSVEFLATDWLTAEKFQALFDSATSQNKELVKHCQDMGSSFVTMIRTFFQEFLDCVQCQIQRLGYLEIVSCNPQPLCAVQLDSMRDIDAGKNPLLSIMLRYMNRNGDVQQRFFGFEGNVPRSAATVSRHVEVAMVRYRDNTVSQSYDGSCVFVGELTNLKRKIQITSPGAVLVPSVDHPLNKVLMQGVFNVRGVQLFVATLEDLVENPKQLKVLARLKGADASGVAESRWSINSKFLSFLLQERESFISAFQQPPDNMCLSMEMSVILKRLINNLHDMKFMFLLFAFKEILKITDELSDVLRLQLSDVNKCADMIKSAITNLRLLKSKNYIEKAKKCLPVEKRTENPSTCSTLFDIVIENLVIQLQSRFGDIKQLEFLQLADSTKFATYNGTFPEQALVSLGKPYGKHFEIKQLEKELRSCIYVNPLFRSLPAVGILKKMREMGLRDSAPQAYKMFCLVATLPISDVDGCTCLKDIHSFIGDAKRHSTDKYINHRSLPTTGLSTLLIKQAQVIIERPLVSQLLQEEEFRYQVMKSYIIRKMEAGVRFECAPLK